MITKKLRHAAFALVAGLMLASTASIAQVAPGPSPVPNVELPVLITNTAAAAATVNSAIQTNQYARGVVCTHNMTAHTGTVSTTIAVQGLDPISNTWQTLGISAAIDTDATPKSIMVYPGIQTASLATGLAGQGVHLPKRWRVQEVIGGTSPVVTGTVGCVTLN